MHPAYFETLFSAEPRSDNWPDVFAIITAFSTTGETWSAEENEAADLLLYKKLQQLKAWTHRVTGHSPDGQHSEPGWAADIDLTEAKQIAAEFRQDAIYCISADTLYVTHCIASAPLVRLGSFHTRFQID